MRIALFHWDDGERRGLAEQLRTWGHEVISGFTTTEGLRRTAPDAFVISLRRLPEDGRETARTLRRRPWAQELPLFFTDGDPEVVDALQDEFPGVRFVTWDALESELDDGGPFTVEDM
ncbi:MAG: hypothetical protein MAG453_00984 [Calditrichaeota bacterium]|nr:hypothetical protein [Calditrichota bacterium]